MPRSSWRDRFSRPCIAARWSSLAPSQVTRSFSGSWDTPLELCIQPVMKRRAEAGNTRPFSPEKVRVKHGSVLSSAARLKADGYDVRNIPYQSATKTVLGWLQPPEVA